MLFWYYLLDPHSPIGVTSIRESVNKLPKEVFEMYLSMHRVPGSFTGQLNLKKHCPLPELQISPKTL